MTINCQTVAGRPADASARLDTETGRVMVSMPPPGTGTFDWYELDQLIAELNAVRLSMPGAPS